MKPTCARNSHIALKKIIGINNFNWEISFFFFHGFVSERQIYMLKSVCSYNYITKNKNLFSWSPLTALILLWTEAHPMICCPSDKRYSRLLEFMSMNAGHIHSILFPLMEQCFFHIFMSLLCHWNFLHKSLSIRLFSEVQTLMHLLIILWVHMSDVSSAIFVISFTSRLLHCKLWYWCWPSSLKWHTDDFLDTIFYCDMNTATKSRILSGYKDINRSRQ